MGSTRFNIIYTSFVPTEKVSPGELFADLAFHLLVAKAPTELQNHAPSGADIDRRARATYRWI